MINLETPKKHVALIDQAHQLAMNMLRPISRKYDRAEHTYPKELDMLAALIDSLKLTIRLLSRSNPPTLLPGVVFTTKGAAVSARVVNVIIVFTSRTLPVAVRSPAEPSGFVPRSSSS